MKTNHSRPWSAEDHQRLIALAGTMPPAAIASELGRTEGAVRVRAKNFDISIATVRINKRWTREEEQYLRDNYQRLTIRQMAKRLERSENAVGLKCAAMGFDCRPYGDKNPSARYCHDDVELCRELFQVGVSRRGISEKMEIPYSTVCAYIRESIRAHG